MKCLLLIKIEVLKLSFCSIILQNVYTSYSLLESLLRLFDTYNIHLEKWQNTYSETFLWKLCCNNRNCYSRKLLQSCYLYSQIQEFWNHNREVVVTFTTMNNKGDRIECPVLCEDAASTLATSLEPMAYCQNLAFKIL